MKRLIITLAAAATAAGASAQQWGGLLMDKDLLMPTDMIELSQTQFNFGTARAMAMAGAFTSLGADLSSMSINPAGLGMYRHGDISITPMMSFARSKGNAPEYGRNSRDRFSMANIGVVINAYEGSRSLISLNVGFGYNRIADFNYDYGFVRQNQGATIGDAYARQLKWDGVSKNKFYTNGGSGDWVWPNDPQYWNAMLAYRGFLIDQTDPDDPGTWKPTWVGNNAGVDHYTMLRSKGSIGEYVLSVGANINNKIYIGASLGIQSVYQRKYIDYVEEYFYDTPSQNTPDFGNSGLDYQLLRWKLNQSVIVDGTGVNFKAGIVYRPTANLRLGAAIHTPTYYSLDRKFQSAAAGLAYANNDTDPNVTPDKNGYISTANDPNMTSPLLVDDGPNGWSFVSPTRLMFGASYTFGERGVISVDYERDCTTESASRTTPRGWIRSRGTTIRSARISRLRTSCVWAPSSNPCRCCRCVRASVTAVRWSGTMSFRRHRPSSSRRPITAQAWDSSCPGACCSTWPISTCRRNCRTTTCSMPRTRSGTPRAPSIRPTSTVTTWR